MKRYLNVFIKSMKGLFHYLITGQVYKLTPSNIKGYFQGVWRLENLFTSSLPSLVEEQFVWRVSVMNPTCILNKMCPCQCEIPAKQLEDRACELNCYPPLMNLEQWEKFKRENKLDMYRIKEQAINKLIN